MKATKYILMALCVASVGIGSVQAKEKKKDSMSDEYGSSSAKGKAAPAAAAAKAPMMTPECIAYMTPGDGQKKLEAYVGNFTYQVKMWMDPAGQPMMMGGTLENKWVDGGRHLHQLAKSDPDPNMGGQAFEGHGFMAYDNFKKEYISMWVDNMGTGMMISKGQMAADGTTLNQMGTMPDPMSGAADKPFRTVTRWTDADTMVYEMYSGDKTGKEFKMMEITYKRVKA